MPDQADETVPHVVIVGAGFGGMACARALGGKKLRVTLVDRNNFHLFLPLLYQVATAALSPADIAQPVRRILARHRNIQVLMRDVAGLDLAKRLVSMRDGPPLAYDALVLAAGADHSYFGHDDWAAAAPGLRSIEDAREIRARLLTAFERAETESDAAARQALVTIVIVGGGPTGVEMAGAVAELARYALARDFRHVDPRAARIVLVEAGPRILPAFPENLAAYAAARLRRLGVEVRTGQSVEAIDARGATVAGERIAAANVIWGAGVKAAGLAAAVPAERDRAGRIVVAPDLSVPGIPGLFVIGDMAHCRGPDGEPLPGLAQVADQQGAHLGAALPAHLSTGIPVPPFRFRNRGNTAIIGRNSAVFDFGRRQLKGTLAWLLWAIVHVYLLVGFEKRLLVTLQWAWRWFTYQRGARLILPTTRRGSRGPASPPDSAG